MVFKIKIDRKFKFNEHETPKFSLFLTLKGHLDIVDEEQTSEELSVGDEQVN